MEDTSEQLENSVKDETSQKKASWLQPYQFKKGQSGNPSGRPAGKSLKEYAKEMINKMTDEERQEFLNGIDKKIIWEMAEGKAKQDTDITSGGEKIQVNLINYGGEKDNNDSV
jgi:hypothetical protein